MVGRGDELERLETLLGLEAGDPTVTAVLLGGDAGVGKTRMLAELRPRAIAAGWRVVVGHCLNFGDSALPYLPFSEVFGRLVEQDPEVAESVVKASPDVARLMPGRRVLAAADEAGEERVDRAGLLEAVHVGLTALSQSQPLLVLIEDVHWADQSTREMLSFLFSRRFDAPVAIVASYRSDDLHRRHPLRPLAAEWGRLPGVTRLQLERLPDADVRTLVGVLHPAPLPEEKLRGIVARAEGNAFFTEELVAAAEMGGGKSVPTDLADLLLVRLDQLDEAARQVVRAASVAGRRVPHELLAHVAGLDGSALDLALRAAVDGNVLISIGTESYGFRHALLAEAIYDDLLPGERVRLHGAFARALCDGDVVGTAAELARHARAAHMVETAVTASIQAGEEAMKVGGPDEAARHYEVALELLAGPDAQDGDGVDVDVVGLTVKASEAAFAAGHLLRAQALVQERLDQLPASAPAVQRARLLHALVSIALLTENSLDLLALTTEALQLVVRRAAQPAARPGAQRACPRQRRPSSRRRGSRVGGEGADAGHRAPPRRRRGRRRHHAGSARRAGGRPGVVAPDAGEGHRGGPGGGRGGRRAARPLQPGPSALSRSADSRRPARSSWPVMTGPARPAGPGRRTAWTAARWP